MQVRMHLRMRTLPAMPKTLATGFTALALLLLAVSRMPAPAAAQAALPPPPASLETLPLAKIERGQKGYGLSVFAGSERERFDVEVLGVIHELRPNVSYVLARLS